MATFTFNIYQTLGIAVVMLLLGKFLQKKVRILDRFCIPAPVIGGLIFAILACILYGAGVIEFEYDDTLKDVFMIFFFTTVGFNVNLKVLKQGGKDLIILVVLVFALINIQNLAAVNVSNVMGVNPMLGMCTGSIPMVGGHGTSAAFGPILEDFGISGATSICTAAATFGLVAGSLLGGPVGNGLIKRKNLLSTASQNTTLDYEQKTKTTEFKNYASAVFTLAIAVGIGTVVSNLLSLTGLTFPSYIGAMIVAAIIRNLSEYKGIFKIHTAEIDNIGEISLSLFLGIALITLKLWQLAGLALPLIILLAVQLGIMFLFARFVIFNCLGRDYDAAVITAGTCGFGMGATPNAMANMQVLCDKYVPSIKAYLIIPVVGGIFVDFMNAMDITLFINVL